jgi:hypothetical protein
MALVLAVVTATAHVAEAKPIPNNQTNRYAAYLGCMDGPSDVLEKRGRDTKHAFCVCASEHSVGLEGTDKEKAVLRSCLEKVLAQDDADTAAMFPSLHKQ